MASYLLDTHTILWYFDQSSELSETAFRIITNQEHSIFVSMASYWEMTIKSGLKKLKLPHSIGQMIRDAEKAGIQSLPISTLHLTTLDTLPPHHRDPFDRLILAQALADNMTLISKDATFRLYSNKVIW
ncbi:MAG: type II toxin-antitoxin system VapC family toxin [Bacteroidia bacterium]